jgi:putative CocE/NonD family hydrolase
MTVASWAFARAAKLGKPTSAEVLVERDLETKLNDGAVLLADRWYAPDTVGSAPVILMRSPYGRRQMGIFGRLFAERGYQVVIQSCRGTFGSSGPFVPFRFEEPDGVGTLEWIEAQPWYTGAIGTFGPSYLGIVQWAVADHADGHVQAMAMQVTAANARDAVVYPGGSFSMETGAVWIQQMEYQERSPLRFALVLAGTKRRLAKAYARLPLRDADLAAHGHHIDYYQEWLVHDQPDDPFWADLDFSQKLDRVPPCSHVAGWYDIFLPGQINDVVGLREAGRDARITIGPWSHMSPGAAAEGIRDALVIFDARLKGRTAPTPAPFRIHVAGTDRWVDLESWPPPAVPTRWYLQGGRGLATDRPRGGPAGP